MSDDTPTFGGIYRRSRTPSEQPTLREVTLPPMLSASRVLRSPPTREKAFELAHQFLAGGQAQRDVGRDGIEDLCLRIIADEEERREIEATMIVL